MRYQCSVFLVFLTLPLSACFVQGSTCSGPFCVSVATEIDDDDCGSDCERQNRCPDADSIRALSFDALSQARQLSTQSICTVPGTAATTPVNWNETLFAVADRHARDMASNNFVATSGSDGVSAQIRVTELGSSLSNVRQLVAGGFYNSRTLINEWQQQPDECTQLLDASATQFAMACRYDRNSDFGTYWSLVLATE